MANGSTPSKGFAAGAAEAAGLAGAVGVGPVGAVCVSGMKGRAEAWFITGAGAGAALVAGVGFATMPIKSLFVGAGAMPPEPRNGISAGKSKLSVGGAGGGGADAEDALGPLEQRRRLQVVARDAEEVGTQVLEALVEQGGLRHRVTRGAPLQRRLVELEAPDVARRRVRRPQRLEEVGPVAARRPPSKPGAHVTAQTCRYHSSIQTGPPLVSQARTS